MEVMRFTEKQKKVTIYEIDDGARDVVICTNEREVTEENPNDEAEKATMYEYDGNILYRLMKSVRIQNHFSPMAEMNSRPMQWWNMPIRRLTNTQLSSWKKELSKEVESYENLG